ncbi:anaerobic ribonucleoside-triphosphate reductase activating protein [Desulfatitalea alkaliphila]|uniref:Anaerobic ribonucleoside-triphosphate reductase activating protein n=1 Tax=Desulfatitalea alkaliphila TaxID=2929485 RepID=A0AA41R7G4_9BACT|nr:anaerobic ribonucleoside-triphosphate reductase activating protein [Desulfatitalea alkaliphila]MCJ8500408.1 anaerobic ribonucleoside-triphosphate reductase activating protein [Desulfatitalea alkaliphila]
MCVQVRDGQPLLAGLQKNTLIDFPGRVGCVVFFTGCNFACPYCHNPELARGAWPQRITLRELIDFLQPRRHLIDGVVISGGEPTLHPALPELCRAIRRIGQAVKLDTNGSRPAVVEKLLQDRLVDYVAMDIKTAPDHYASPWAAPGAGAAVVESMRLLMRGTIPYEFRTTCVRPFVDTPTVAAIAGAVKGARRYTLQTFRTVDLLHPGFFDGADPGFSPSEMAELQRVVAPFVGECLVR